MTNLGLQLAWCAWQVSLVLVPAALIHLAASRRSAVSGSGIAALALALAVALAAMTWISRAEPAPTTRPLENAASRREAATNVSAKARHTSAADRTPAPFADTSASPPGGISLALGRAGGFFRGLERQSSAQFEHLRRWGVLLAVAVLAGALSSVLQLAGGLWAVRIARARSRPVDDLTLHLLLDSIRTALGCKRKVELRVLDDLLTPATAGWVRPVIFLPTDWRNWSRTECQAVLAHELAHVVRADYAAGLVARLAAALHFYHPLVHWLAARLHWQQEVAADALAARLAGGRSVYLLALSRLALSQDGRSPGWPARAFLPRRGTLIRRIDMLQNEPANNERPWPRLLRLTSAGSLVALAALAGLLPRPALSDAPEDPSPAAKAPAPQAASIDTNFEWLYVPDKMDGVVVARPAAALKRLSRPGLAALLSKGLAAELRSLLQHEFPQAPKDPATPTFRLDQVEWVCAGVRLGESNQKNEKGQPEHSLVMSVGVIRMAAPFDWLAFLRGWNVEYEEVKTGARPYYTITGKLGPIMGRSASFYVADDRMIVFDDSQSLAKLAARGKPTVPDYLAGPDWQQASQGLLAVAINNRDNSFVKRYDLKRSDDAAVVPLWQGAERWVASIADIDQLTLRAQAVCAGDREASAIVGAAQALIALGLKELEKEKPAEPAADLDARVFRFAERLLKSLHIESASNSVTLGAEAGPLTEIGALLEAEATPHQDANTPAPQVTISAKPAVIKK